MCARGGVFKSLIWRRPRLAPPLPYRGAMSTQKAPDGNTRWRVAIVDDHERSRTALRSAIWTAGGTIVGEAVRCSDVLAMVRRASPDVLVCAVGLPDGDGVQAAAQVGQAGCPVVLFTSHTDEALVERARAAGVMGFLLKPLRPAELAPVLDLAIARFKDNRQLKQSLEGRKVIERAKGTLMARLGLTEDEAFRRLRRAAMDSRRPMVDIAKALLVSETVAKP
jgi:AmiR/NasT family two-component response regulator